MFGGQEAKAQCVTKCPHSWPGIMRALWQIVGAMEVRPPVKDQHASDVIQLYASWCLDKWEARDWNANPQKVNTGLQCRVTASVTLSVICPIVMMPVKCYLVPPCHNSTMMWSHWHDIAMLIWIEWKYQSLWSSAPAPSIRFWTHCMAFNETISFDFQLHLALFKAKLSYSKWCDFRSCW